MKEIRAKAFAKINPVLEILSKREDGYHNLNLTYLNVGLCDRLRMEPRKGREIILEDQTDIPREENLCMEAAKLLQKEVRSGVGASISLQKNIPAGRGLGGGSSDAAAVMAGLNILWNSSLSEKELGSLGAKIGSDVPFFFKGGYCAGKGKGDELREKANPYRKRRFLLIKPKFSLSTPKVYSAYDRLEEGTNAHEKTGPFRNDLAEAALELKPELKEYFDFFENSDQIEGFNLSGSGSSIFGLIAKGAETGRVVEKANRYFPEATTFTLSPVEKGYELTPLP